ncbi:MAG TPA: ABC transporter substrate-binding protein [Thermoplasmata archaeon]|nr:ABC transporter substrate-binding protein [Thermoplasmata archaeon]
MLVVVAILVIAGLATFFVLYLGSGSIFVTSNNQFIPAGGSTSFTATVTPPPFVSSTGMRWDFGDGNKQSSTGDTIAHTYANPGNYFVLSTASLSNGKTVDNAQGLFPVQVGAAPVANPDPLGTTTSLGALSFNKTQSSPGAPFIAVGAHIAFVGAVAQPPDFEFDDLVDSVANSWVNYTWQVTRLTINFGDGSTPATNNSRLENATTNTLVADPYMISHTYNSGGIFSVSLTVTTGNFSAAQTNSTPAHPVLTATGQGQTTVVGLTVAVGSYREITYSGNVIKPGIITNMEAVTGGYTTLDPALDYESTGFEVISNIYETLLAYNGTSTSNFVPVVADQIPTVANGRVSPDFMNYTFHIRQGLKFSNGDSVTAWDVKYSISRTMLFNSGSPFPPGWIISQFFVPGTFISGLTNPDGSINATQTFGVVDGAVSVNNNTQEVTFHLISPAPPLLFYQVVADPLGAGIMDHLWLESTGPKLIWNPAGFVDYEKYSALANYVPAWRNGAVGSGPYMIDYVANPDSVVLKPNPSFQVLPGVPAATVSKVVLQYVADASTRELSLESGQADIAGIPSAHFDVAKRLSGLGLIRIQFNPTLNMFWWNFNLEIYQSTIGPNSNPYGNEVPSNFFVDLNMRKAFAYAYNYGQYIDQILGNKKFNATFGTPFNGIIPSGMIGYQDLSSLNVFDMTLAHQYYNQTAWVRDHGWRTSGFTIAINVETADIVNRAAAAAWAQNIEQLAPPGQIHVVIKPISFEEMITNSVPHVDPMGIYFLGWLADYPFPTDYTLPMLLPADSPVTSSTPDGGTYPNANGYNIQYLAADPNGTNQVAASTNIRNWILDSISAPNATNVNQVVIDSQQAQQAFANLWYYVPAFQQYTFFSFRTWITGMDKELNPTLGGLDLLYDLITKPSTTTTSSSPGGYFVATGVPFSVVATAAALSRIALVPLGGRTFERGWQL